MFEYDESKALRSEASSRIYEPGAYIGTILQAEHVKAHNSAAEFLRFMYRTDEGVIAWLTLFTKKKDGTEAFGLGYVHALMGLLGIQRMQAVPAQCRAMNGEVINGQRYVDLENKKIGFVLGMRDRKYTDENGFERIAYDPQIVRIFHPVTRKTITETKKNMEPKNVDRDVQAQKEAFEKLKAKNEAQRSAEFESQPRKAADTFEDAPF